MSKDRELPILPEIWTREDLLRCTVCAHNIPPEIMVRHVEKCWGIKYSSVEEIPNNPPREATAFHLEKPMKDAYEAMRSARGDKAKGGGGKASV